MPPNRDINTTLKFILDKNSLQQVQAGTMSVEDALSNVQQRLIQSKKHLVDIVEDTKKWEVQARRNLVTSTAFVTGLFLYSQRYIKNLEQSNSLSKRWEASSKSIEKSQERIGKVVTEAVLPAFEYGARVTEKISKFVEANPELVKTALNVGLLVLGFNALSIIAAKGIRLAADVSYIATTATQLLASKQMQDAANKQLAASATMSGNQWAQSFRNQTGYGAPQNMNPIAAVSLIVAGLIATGVIIKFIDDMIAKTQLGDSIQSSQRNIIENSRNPYPGALSPALRQEYGIGNENPFQKFIDKIKEFVGILDETAIEIEQINNRVEGSKFEEQIVDAYTRMKEQEKIATEQYEKEKSKIIDQYNKSNLIAISNNAKAIDAILSSYQKQLQRITSDYQRSNAESERRHAEQRAQIVRDGGIQIQRMEEDLQERLAKLRENYQDKVDDAVARRDALALKKAKQDYDKQSDEETKNTNKEIARRRQDLAIRLRDMDESFRAERQARFENYKLALADAKAQRDEALKEQKERHEEEIRQLQLAKQEQLRLLRENYMEENKRRKEVFIAMVRDLDASLIGEQRLKQKYYLEMLKDVDRFLQNYRATMANNISGGSVSFGNAGGGKTNRNIRDSGGYMERGTYHVAQNGIPEYAMKGNLTKFAESLVGGRLTQENLAGLMMRGSMQSVTINENNRYSSKLSKADIRMIEEMQDRKIERLFK